MFRKSEKIVNALLQKKLVSFFFMLSFSEVNVAMETPTSQEGAQKKICELTLENGYKLVPYQKKHKRDFKAVVNNEGVYPYIRDGKLWSDEVIEARHVAYLKGNCNDNSVYKPNTFLACWVLLAPKGEVIGRGGFQVEDGCAPIATEVFFAIEKDFQGKGLGTACFKAIVNWFDQTVGSDILLRWLTMKENAISRKLAKSLGFEPRMTLWSGQPGQVFVNQWNKNYLVYERKGLNTDG
ncbi:MAG: GNAT family N-acetyltransferase [Alphaproteobacteria bacterium]|nr:GNAT family N-acetyltransferase [Alphaproteobacteria bacterium]